MKQASAWLEIYHYDEGKMCWGIECDDPSLTFDGLFMCIFPGDDDDHCQKVALEMLDYLVGKKQLRRLR